MWADILSYFNVFLVVFLSIYGLHSIVITALYLLRFQKTTQPVTEPPAWPLVAVQLPLYNEHSVAERMVKTVCALDYPRDRLIIQLLDDSTDQTTAILEQQVELYHAQGFHIELLHRSDRTGYKARAMAEGLAQTDAEFIAVFDADFIPPANYLKQVIPHFFTDPRLGMVQARWGHLNRETNAATRAQALYLDGHQIVQQVARSRWDLLMIFNGSGGVWRAECIRDSGGWQWDTFAEDLDLSYRARMCGWRLAFLPDLVVPAELPPTITIFKKQQYRWVYGHIQVLRKLLFKVWRSPQLTLAQRIDSTFTLTTNLTQIAALSSFLLSLPLALLHPQQPGSLGLISMASMGPTILFIISQVLGYKDGFAHKFDRLTSLPALILLAVGMSISNASAVVSALTGQKITWVRTPKYNLEGQKTDWAEVQPQIKLPLMVWLEIAVSFYCAVGLSLAISRAPEVIPLTALGMLSYGYVGFSGLAEYNRPKKSDKVSVEVDRVETV